MKQVCLICLVFLWTDLQLTYRIWRAWSWIILWPHNILLSLFRALLNIEKGTPLESSLSSFQILEIWKDCRALVLFNSLTYWKWHLLSISLTLFSGWDRLYEKGMCWPNMVNRFSLVVFYTFSDLRDKSTKKNLWGFLFVPFQTL